MHTLVTGGAGFIGSFVADYLLRRGDTVTVLDDFNDRYDPRLKEARIEHVITEPNNFTLVRADIRDQERVNELFAEAAFDAVIHLAAWASVLPSIENPHIYSEVNIDGTVNILEAARKNKVKNIVFASSSSVYGGLKELPFREDADITSPTSPYAATKAAGEILCATWHNLYGIPISCLRFFTVYGPWGRPEMSIFKLTQAIDRDEPVAIRGRTTSRDFTYIDDIVQGVIGALDTRQGFQVYNLGENDAVPLPRLIAALETALNKKATVKEVPLLPGELPQTLADITKAQRELGYDPKTKIEAGVAKFVEWYRSWYVPHFK